MDDFKTIIGLEVHAQLNTKSKMFCSCDNNSEGKEINEVTCPICMAMPGTLPVANIEAIKKTIKTGLALGCKINEVSKFDRKHYFYPDLPKGYQISQYDQPFCVGGELEVEGKNIHFNRIHLEEDAGKLIHPKGSKYTIVDLNRAGTPLMEMVTEPDIHSPLIAKLFLQELQQILRSLQVSSADMEKGHMRCDANISVVKDGKSSPIIELKNLNSFKFVEKALIFEAKRLRNEFESFDGKMNKQTRRFDATTGKTLAMREKEEAKDYRYFPEPDVPPFVIAQAKEIDLEKIKEELNDLPSVVRMRLSERGISPSDAAQIYKNKPVLELLEKCLEIDNKYLARIAKILINERSAVKLSAKDLVLLAKTAEEAKMPSNILRAMIEQAAKGEKSVSEIIEESKTDSDGSDISEIVEKVLSQNAEAVEKYRAGKTEVTGFLIGQVMRDSRGKANPNEIREEIIKQIVG